MVTLMPVTPGAYREYMHQEPDYGIRGIMGVDDDGNIVGMGGVQYRPDGVFAFMQWDEGNVSPKDIVRGTNVTMRRVVSQHRLVYAFAKDMHTAPGFLEHYGFEPVESDSTGETYRWVKTPTS